MSQEDYVIGTITGTGDEISEELGFVPRRVNFQISESSIIGYWDSGMRDGTLVVEHCGELRAGEILIGKHLPFIGVSSNLDIGNNRVVTQHDAAGDVRVEIAAAETTLADTTDDISADKWGCYLLATASNGTISVTPTTTSGPMVHETEALAIADLAATPANEAALGYVTVQALADAIFNANTDALNSGQANNYYEGYGVMSGGVTPYGLSSGDTFRGFKIGTSALMNIANSIIEYQAFR